MLRNLATSLVLHDHLVTTSAKAQELRAYFEPLVTRVKRSSDSVAIRFLQSSLTTQAASERFLTKARSLQGDSGWLRIAKVGYRDGDGSEVAQVSFVS